MVAAGAEDAARRIGVSIRVVDARGAVRPQHRVEGVDLGLAVRPDRAELRLDGDSGNDGALHVGETGTGVDDARADIGDGHIANVLTGGRAKAEVRAIRRALTHG